MKGLGSDEVVVLLFVGIVCLIYFFCFRILRRVLKEGERSRPKFYEWPVLLAGFFGLCCFVYGAMEPFQLENTFVGFSSDKLKEPIRIIHLTDLHCDGVKRNEKRLPKTVAALHPDLIVFTGDAANNRSGLEDFKICMSELSNIAPVYGVYGNHDARSGRGYNTFAKTNIRKLDCTSEVITIKNNKIWIGGAPADGEGYVANTMTQAPADAFTIFLYHYPSGLNAAVAHNIDLICTGHTHGGQIRLPYYGALVTNSELGKKFEYGLYKVNATHMNVSRGIGMVGPPVRFLAPPEVAVIDVRPGEQQAKQ